MRTYRRAGAEVSAKLGKCLPQASKIQEDRTMIKLIVGAKGSGKTKTMIDQINDAVKTSKATLLLWKRA